MTNVPPPIVNVITNIPLAETNVAVINNPPTIILSLPIGTVFEVIAIKEIPNAEIAKAFFLNSNSDDTQITQDAQNNLVEFDIKVAKALPPQTLLQLKLTNINQNGTATLKIVEKIPVENLKNMLSAKSEQSNYNIINDVLKTNNGGVIFDHGKPVNAMVINPESLKNMIGNNNIAIAKSIQPNILNTENNVQKVNSYLPDGSVLSLRITEVASIEGRQTLATNNLAQTSNQLNTQAIGGDSSENSHSLLGSFKNNILEDKTQNLFFSSLPKQNEAEKLTVSNLQASRVENQPTRNESLDNSVFNKEAGIATVVGKTSSGQSIVSSNLGIMILETKTSIPLNTNIKIEVLSLETPKDIKMDLANNISVFNHIENENIKNIASEFKMFALESPVNAVVLASRIPQANQNLASSIINFITAVQKNEISSFVGEENLKTLAKTNAGQKLVKAIDKEITETNKKIEENKDFKHFNIPFLTDNGEIKSIVAIIKREGGGKRNRQQKEKQRFIFEVSLSNLGEMQIDTLVAKEFKRLDIILRNKKELPNDVALGIGRIFRDTLDAFGYAGTLSFMVTDEFFQIDDAAEAYDKHKGIVI